MSFHHRGRPQSYSVYPRSENPSKKQAKENPYERHFFENLTDFILLKAEGHSQGLPDPEYTVVSLIALPYKSDGKTKMLYPIRQFKDRWSSIYDNQVSKKFVNDALKGNMSEDRVVSFDELGEAGRATVLDFVDSIRAYQRKKNS